MKTNYGLGNQIYKCIDLRKEIFIRQFVGSIELRKIISLTLKLNWNVLYIFSHSVCYSTMAAKLHFVYHRLCADYFFQQPLNSTIVRAPVSTHAQMVSPVSRPTNGVILRSSVLTGLMKQTVVSENRHLRYLLLSLCFLNRKRLFLLVKNV